MIYQQIQAKMFTPGSACKSFLISKQTGSEMAVTKTEVAPQAQAILLATATRDFPSCIPPSVALESMRNTPCSLSISP